MPLSWNEIRQRAANFVEDWKGAAPQAREEADAQTFQTDFLSIFGVSRKQVAIFEHRVPIGGEVDLFGGHTGDRKGYVDMFWKRHILTEMKTPGKDLKKAYTQAKEYVENLPPDDLPVGILISDFVTFEYYDLESGGGEPRIFTLQELPNNVELFGYLAGYWKVTYRPTSAVDIAAAEHMGALHDAMKESGYEGHDLEMYLVRLLFCLFADDTGVFDQRKFFFEYIDERTSKDGSDLALHLGQIFDTLNTPEEKRLKNLDEQLKKFPYVDGGLFAERLQTAAFTRAMRDTLIRCCALDWSQIKPEIFGAMFQSVKDKDKRRALGEHYTSEQNILKIVNPLFLDSLKAEFAKIKALRSAVKEHNLYLFHDKLCRLKFLDPACGCGNFLIVAYREIRLLEIEVIRELMGFQMGLDLEMVVRVNVDQFYGIEIEEFPARIAQTALWLMDHLMNNEVSKMFQKPYVRIPLTASPNIVIGNALVPENDWEKIVPKTELAYILGNPPFVGARLMNQRQKDETLKTFEGLKNAGNLDYVTCWYKKAAAYMQGTAIEAAFVSTNSICQGQQVPLLWPSLMENGININFAHQAFKWTNEARGKAAVHCVIVGFGIVERKEKRLFHYSDVTGTPNGVTVSRINPYLVDAQTIFLTSRRDPVCNVSKMIFGSMPNDGGNLLLTQEERNAIVKEYADAKHLIRPFVGADEFLYRAKRYCVWLKGVSPAQYANNKAIRERIRCVKLHRENSRRAATGKLADFPSLFGEIRQPESDYLLFPEVSSEKYVYIPIGFMRKEIIASNRCLLIPNATFYEFGILTSSMHNAWARRVSGRLELRLNYSIIIVYNNFPWPNPTDKQREAVETAAQGVLDARASFPDSSLSVLYDPETMPPSLRKAHQRLDKAVEKAYGKEFTNDDDRVAHLFYLYQKLTEGLLARKARRRNI
ncbi:MAG: methylase [Treponematales bacterium]